jgi:hypothetical protein
MITMKNRKWLSHRRKIHQIGDEHLLNSMLTMTFEYCLTQAIAVGF